jgi:hypothetical protein
LKLMIVLDDMYRSEPSGIVTLARAKPEPSESPNNIVAANAILTDIFIALLLNVVNNLLLDPSLSNTKN